MDTRACGTHCKDILPLLQIVSGKPVSTEMHEAALELGT